MVFTIFEVYFVENLLRRWKEKVKWFACDVIGPGLIYYYYLLQLLPPHFTCYMFSQSLFQKPFPSS